MAHPGNWYSPSSVPAPRKPALGRNPSSSVQVSQMPPPVEVSLPLGSPSHTQSSVTPVTPRVTTQTSECLTGLEVARGHVWVIPVPRPLIWFPEQGRSSVPNEGPN